MSEENVEIVRKATDAFNRGDWDRFAATIPDDGRMTPLENWPERGPFRGRAEVLRQYQRLVEDFSSQITLLEAREEGEWVVASYLWAIEGTGSGARVEVAFTGAHRLTENRQVAESHFRFDHADALEAAGLSE